MRYLSLLLLGPWLIVLAWAYWAVQKRTRITWQQKVYDAAVVVVALGAAYASALVAFDDGVIGHVGSFGRESGGIWKQVMPALYGYGAFAVVMVVGIVARPSLRHAKSRSAAQQKAKGA
jgi:hypothetical protein